MRIDRRYCGPADSGNGGVTCGMLAGHLDAPVVEVTLRRPPPLETDLRVEDGSLYDGDLLVASAVASSVDLDTPPVVSLQEAVAAAERYPGRVDHPFPTCFACGIDREPPDALGLRPGPVDGDVVAAVWTPTEEADFLLWAALDCPGGWSTMVSGRPMVLGRMTLERRGTPELGVPHVAQGWTVSSEGRKSLTGTALYDPDGQVLAVASQVWIAIG